METARVKTFFIFVLLAVNIFLLMLVAPRQVQLKNKQSASQENVIKLLASSGISFDTSVLDGDITLYRLGFENKSKAELAVVNNLFGQSYLDEQLGAVSDVYQANNGTADFRRNGEFSIFFAPEFEEPEYDAEQPGGVAAIEKSALAILEKAGFELWDEVKVTIHDGRRVDVSATQQLMGAPVHSSGAVIRYVDGKATTFEGMWFLGEAVVADSTPCVSVNTALLAFLNSQNRLGWICSEITRVSQCYMKEETPSIEEIYLTPVWEIVTDTGVFHVNGLDCSVRMAEPDA